MIRAMTAEDIPRVSEIRVGVLFGQIEDGYELYVYDDGVVKGFMGLCPCRDEDEIGSFELGAIYIDPLMQGRGIGSKLVGFCEKTAIERGYKRVVI